MPQIAVAPDQEGRVDNQWDTCYSARLAVQRIGATSVEQCPTCDHPPPRSASDQPYAPRTAAIRTPVVRPRLAPAATTAHRRAGVRQPAAWRSRVGPSTKPWCARVTRVPRPFCVKANSTVVVKATRRDRTATCAPAPSRPYHQERTTRGVAAGHVAHIAAAAPQVVLGPYPEPSVPTARRRLGQESEHQFGAGVDVNLAGQVEA